MILRLSDFDAFTFDVYGTLIDWEPAIATFLEDWARRRGVAATGAALLTGFDRARAGIQKERPAPLYPEVLRCCFDRIARGQGVEPDPADRDAFARSPHGWPPFADSAAGLRALQRGARIGALSNIDEASLASSCRQLGVAFDIVVTAERVGAYKPDLQHFDTAIADLAALGIARERILHVGQSLRADIAPANRLGLRSAWIHRPGRSLGLSGEGAAEARPDLTANSLEALVAILSANDAAR